MNKIIICVGISGSGKSTFSTNYIKENNNTLRINRDDIRKTLVGDLDGYYQRKDLNSIEDIVTDLEDDIFNTIIRLDKNIIIDNTNLKQSYINRWLRLTDEYYDLTSDYTDVKFKLFDISLEEAKERVSFREFEEGFNETWSDNQKKLEYIDKQYIQYQEIKKYLETNYKDQII